jgi:hypothetical protein
MKKIEQAAANFARECMSDKVNQQIEMGFLAGAEFAQRWISVKDELPENSDVERYYLVKLSSAASDRPFLAVAYRNDAFCSPAWSRMDSVTHWRLIELK